MRVVSVLRAAAIGGIATALSLIMAPGAHAATKASSATATIRGLDISAYQHTGSPIDWNSLAAAGVRFVAIKVSEGTYYTNPYYRSDARAALKAGLAVLSYVFANPGRASGPATASFALSKAGSALGSLPLVVDLENDPYSKKTDCYGLTAPAMIAWIAGFLSEAEALTGHVPLIYTTADWWQECTGDTAKFRRAPLWLAAFTGTPPTAPSPWQDWTFLQYDNEGTLPGLGQVDLDYYHPSSNLLPLGSPLKQSRHKPAPASKQKPDPQRDATTRPARQAKTKPRLMPKRTRQQSAAQKGKR